MHQGKLLVVSIVGKKRDSCGPFSFPPTNAGPVLHTLDEVCVSGITEAIVVGVVIEERAAFRFLFPAGRTQRRGGAGVAGGVKCCVERAGYLFYHSARSILILAKRLSQGGKRGWPILLEAFLVNEDEVVAHSALHLINVFAPLL